MWWKHKMKSATLYVFQFIKRNGWGPPKFQKLGAWLAPYIQEPYFHAPCWLSMSPSVHVYSHSVWPPPPFSAAPPTALRCTELSGVRTFLPTSLGIFLLAHWHNECRGLNIIPDLTAAEGFIFSISSTLKRYLVYGVNTERFLTIYSRK